MKKVMLLAAMLAMVLAAAVPALAQSVTQVGNGNVACVQTAVQQEFGKTQISQYGDNINIQAISQECNIAVSQVNKVVATVTATATATAAPKVQYSASASAAPAVQYQYSASPSATASATASASASASPAAELPETRGSSVIALGAGVLLVAGGLLARRIVR